MGSVSRVGTRHRRGRVGAPTVPTPVEALLNAALWLQFRFARLGDEGRGRRQSRMPESRQSR